MQDDRTTAVAPNNQAPATGIALVLQGGGARAAYQVGVLKAIAEVLGQPKQNPFPIIVGTSAGGINAAVLASHADNFARGVTTLEHMWHNIAPNQVYRSDVVGVVSCSTRWLISFFFGALSKNRRVSLFDNSPLQKTLTTVTNPVAIQSHLDAGLLTAVAVNASGYTSGQNCTFFQAQPQIEGWKRSQRVGIRVKELLPQHLMASAAIPFAFPAIKINREFFGDGSIRQTAPISPALHLGASRIYVIGTAKLIKDFPSRSRSEAYPSLAQIAGHAMSSIFLDSLATDLELLHRVNSTVGLVDTEKLKTAGVALKQVDVMVSCPNEPLEASAHRHVVYLPAPIRFLMRSIGAMRKGGAALASYLLFDPHYCRALIEMGYQETIQRRDELRLFFDPTARPVSTVVPEVKFNPMATQQMQRQSTQDTSKIGD
jgi:NTE family protein